MKQRVITAIVALIIFIPIIVYGGGLIEFAAAVLGIVAMDEFYKMKYDTPHYGQEAVAILAMLALILPWKQWFPILPSPLFLYYIFIMILMAMMVFDQKDFHIDSLGFPVFTSLYLGIGFHSFIAARFTSLIVLLFALFIVWSTDIGAYMIGRKIGKHKLAPSISPNKTVEGAIGGIVCAVVVSALYLWKFGDHFPYSMPMMLIFVVIFSIAGQLGDLVESSYKRFYGVKDSGKILPGHGGILDRFDSLLFVFPMMYILGLFTM